MIALAKKRPGFWLLVFIILLSGYRLLAIGGIPMTPDEAYYFAWSRRLAVCYYDQPGMVAWVDWLFAQPFIRPTAFTVRLAAAALSALSTWLFYRAYREYREDEAESAIFAGIFSILPFTWLTGIIMIHDTTLLPWLGLAYWMLIRLVKFDGRPRDWFLVAFALAGAMYAKFSAVMIGWGLLLFMIWSPKGRRWWRTGPPYAAGIFAALLYAPVILWNYRHHWISVHAVSELTAAEGLTLAQRLRLVLEYLGSQVGIFSPLIGLLVFGALVLAVREALRRPEEDQAVLPVCLSLPVLLYFLQQSFRSHVFGNWPGVAYLPVAMLAMRQVSVSWRKGPGKWLFSRRYVGLALAGNLLLVFAAWLQLQFRFFQPALSSLSGKSSAVMELRDRLDRDFGRWNEMVEVVQANRAGRDFIMAHNYQVASMLEFMLPDRPRVECYNLGQRGNQWDLWSRLAERKGQTALYVDFKRMPKPVQERFGELLPIANPAVVSDQSHPVRPWFVYEGKGWRGPGQEEK